MMNLNSISYSKHDNEIAIQLTVTRAGDKIPSISSLIAQPGKLKHRNFRLATLNRN